MVSDATATLPQSDNECLRIDRKSDPYSLMRLRNLLLVLVFATAGACASLSTAQAEIRTGSDSVDLVSPDVPPTVVLYGTVLWNVSRGSYYSPSYPDRLNPFGGLYGTAQWSLSGTNSIGGFSLFRADNGDVSAPVQFYTGPLDLDALVDSNQTFGTSGLPEIIGGEIKRFGYSVTMPEAPTPLYGWVELDGSASTPGHLIVNGTWAYDTTGAGIAVGTVPEPTTLVLVGLGCLALLARYRFGRKQS